MPHTWDKRMNSLMPIPAGFFAATSFMFGTGDIEIRCKYFMHDVPIPQFSNFVRRTILLIMIKKNTTYVHVHLRFASWSSNIFVTCKSLKFKKIMNFWQKQDKGNVVHSVWVIRATLLEPLLSLVRSSGKNMCRSQV